MGENEQQQEAEHPTATPGARHTIGDGTMIPAEPATAARRENYGRSRVKLALYVLIAVVVIYGLVGLFS